MRRVGHVLARVGWCWFVLVRVGSCASAEKCSVVQSFSGGFEIAILVVLEVRGRGRGRAGEGVEVRGVAAGIDGAGGHLALTPHLCDAQTVARGFRYLARHSSRRGEDASLVVCHAVSTWPNACPSSLGFKK